MVSLIRDRWSDRRSYVLTGVIAALGAGPLWVVPERIVANGGGAFLVAWLVMLAVISMPLVWLEIANGVCLQSSLPDALRRTGRRWTWLGWWGIAIVALLACFAAVAAGGALGNAVQGLGVVASGALVSDRDSLVVGVLTMVALAAVWVVVQRIARSDLAPAARAIHRLAAVGIAGCGLCLLLTLATPGGRGGVDRLLEPRWEALLSPATWLLAAEYAVFGLLLGCGVQTAFASHLPRSGDVGASTWLIVALAGLGHVLLAIMLAALGGHAMVVRGEMLDQSQPLWFITEPVALIDRADPRFGAVIMVIMSCGLAALLCAAVATWLLAVAGAWCDRFGTVRRGMVTGMVVAAALGCLPFMIDSDGSLFITCVDALAVHGMLPLVALFGWVAVWRIGVEGLQDHITAYSSVRVGAWWRPTLGVVVPFLLLVTWWVNVLLVFQRDDASTWLWLSVGIVPLVVLPLLGTAIHRLSREDEPATRRLVVGFVVVAIVLVMAVRVGMHIVDMPQRARAANLADAADRFGRDRAWDAVSDPTHPLVIARTSWISGDRDQALAAARLLNGRPLDSRDRVLAQAWASELAANARVWLELERPAPVLMIHSLIMLKLLGAEEQHAELIQRLAAEGWYDPVALGALRDAAIVLDAAKPGELAASANAMRRAWQVFVGGSALTVPLLQHAPEPVDVVVRDVELAMRDQVTALSAKADSVRAQDVSAMVDCLHALGLWSQLDGGQRRQLIAASIGSNIGGWALVMLLAVLALVGAILVLVLRRAASGPRPIDPMAETLENVDPIDVDTQAVTMDGTTTGGGISDGGISDELHPTPNV